MIIAGLRSRHGSSFQLLSLIGTGQFISTAIAKKLSALMTENYLNEQAKQDDSPSEKLHQQEKYEAILAKVPDIETEAYDKLPTV